MFMIEGQFINFFEYFLNLKGESSHQVKKKIIINVYKTALAESKVQNNMQLDFLCFRLYVKCVSF